MLDNVLTNLEIFSKHEPHILSHTHKYKFVHIASGIFPYLFSRCLVTHKSLFPLHWRRGDTIECFFIFYWLITLRQDFIKKSWKNLNAISSHSSLYFFILWMQKQDFFISSRRKMFLKSISVAVNVQVWTKFSANFLRVGTALRCFTVSFVWISSNLSLKPVFIHFVFLWSLMLPLIIKIFIN